VENGYGDGEFLFGWGVCAAVALKLPCDESVVTRLVGLVAWIWESVQFKGRADSSERDLNCLHSDRSAAGKCTFPNSVGEHSQGGRLLGSGVVGEAGVQVKEVAVGDPMVPKAFPFAVSRRHDAIVDGPVNKIAIMRETIAELSWNSLQEVFCVGNV